MNERERSQTILDIMFQVLARVHTRDRVPEDLDECMSWARSQLIKCGVDVYPRGMSQAVLAPSKTEWID